MGDWSQEALDKASLAIAKTEGSWSQKIAAGIDAAIEQRRQEDYKVMNQRLLEKIAELEGNGSK